MPTQPDSPAEALDITTPLLTILASAGSGKTYQLSNRIISFLARGASARQMVALTFTRKAAGEFTDALLKKIAAAAQSPDRAHRLDQEIHATRVNDYLELLAQLIRDLPHLRFGTLDSFFLHVVTQFQYEFGIAAGQVSLIDETQQDLLLEQTIDAYIASIADDEAEPLLQAFQRACRQQPLAPVHSTLKGFLAEWMPHFAENKNTPLQWGLIPPSQHGEALRQWHDNRDAWCDLARNSISALLIENKSVINGINGLIDKFSSHAIGSGTIESKNTLLIELCKHFILHPEPDTTGTTELIVHYYRKDVDLTAIREPLRALVLGAAAAEIDSASQSTHAVETLIAHFDQLWQHRFRSQGQLTFADLQQLMGAWKQSEIQRLSREQIDYRLSDSYRHWLLDEFQDTAPLQWSGIESLISSGVENDGSLFVVGDRKQAIYGWRGGDVSLFDIVRAAYAPLGMKFEPMAQSFRSCPDVLEYVNHVFGSTADLAQAFGDVGRDFPWQEHVSANPTVRGHCKVELVACQDSAADAAIDEADDETSDAETQTDQRIQCMIADMRQLGLPHTRLHCGVLVRSNLELRRVSEALRREGFEVVEEGKIAPGRDNPIGVTFTELMRWLANPADTCALETLKMSPLAAVMPLTESPAAAWQAATQKITELGWSDYFAELIADMRQRTPLTLSDFGAHRLQCILQSLRALESQSEVSHHQIAAQLEHLLTPSQSAVATIQVMTIHKSKGLGFDVVFLPLISDEKVPNLKHYKYTAGKCWLCMKTPEWVRSLHPLLRSAEEAWRRDSVYESLCVLYVALTRSKRGLYLYLKAPKPETSNKAKETEATTTSIASFLRSKAMNHPSSDGESSVIFESGKCENLMSTTSAAEVDTAGPSAMPILAAAVARPARLKPSLHSHATPQGRSSGAVFGSRVHALLESLIWPQASDFDPNDELGAYLHQAWLQPAYRDFFAPRPHISVMTEINIDGVMADQHSRGIIDRLHLHRRSDGSVEKADIVDYKTDALIDPAALIERHAPQLNVYRVLTARALHLPLAQVRCYLIALHTQAIHEVPAPPL